MKIKVEVKIHNHPEECMSQNDYCAFICFDGGYATCDLFHSETDDPVELKRESKYHHYLKCDQCKEAYQQQFRFMD